MFILKSIANISDKFNIIRKEDKIISINVTKEILSVNESIEIKLTFRDSLLLLPSSLKDLGKGFGVEMKGDFDHNKSDQCLTPEQFEQIRVDLVNYNKQDCLVLHQVLVKFSKLIFDMFSVNIGNISTIPSLALHIFRSNFMVKDAKIGISDVKLYNKLHQAYTGGAVDVFTPSSLQGEKVYGYDINSLYPSVMKDFEFPVGSPKFVEGHVDISSSFGFIKVKVIAPDNLHIPLLQTKVNGRTVAPLGTWTGWYFSEELKLALTLGYQFEVLEAVLYERGYIFKDYVSTLYKMRQSFDKKDPRNMITKLLLNSLYGKFGMDPHLTEWRLLDSDSVLLKTIKSEVDPVDVIELGGKMLVGEDLVRNQVVENPLSKEHALELLSKRHGVSVQDILNILETDRYGFGDDLMRDLRDLTRSKNHLQISIPIAAAVTAYGRINIYKYKDWIVKNGGTLYYSDTDSIYCSIPLPDNLISNELGAMKLEYVADEAVFLAPKVYAVKIVERDNIGNFFTRFLFKIKGAMFLKDKGKKTDNIIISADGSSDNTFVRKLKFEDLQLLLYKDSTLKMASDKWYRSLTKGTINIHRTLYTLKVTENKRTLIYKDDKFSHTKPFILKSLNI